MPDEFETMASELCDTLRNRMPTEMTEQEIAAAVANANEWKDGTFASTRLLVAHVLALANQVEILQTLNAIRYPVTPESLKRARSQAHQGRRDQLRSDTDSIINERDRLRSQLAAAQEEVARLQRMADAHVVGESDMRDERDAARAEADALRKQVAELQRDAEGIFCDDCGKQITDVITCAPHCVKP